MKKPSDKYMKFAKKKPPKNAQKPNFPTPKGQANSQDSYHNPTTKKYGDPNTAVRSPLKSKKWYDMQGRFQPKNSRD